MWFFTFLENILASVSQKKAKNINKQIESQLNPFSFDILSRKINFYNRIHYAEQFFSLEHILPLELKVETYFSIYAFLCFYENKMLNGEHINLYVFDCPIIEKKKK